MMMNQVIGYEVLHLRSEQSTSAEEKLECASWIKNMATKLKLSTVYIIFLKEVSVVPLIKLSYSHNMAGEGFGLQF